MISISLMELASLTAVQAPVQMMILSWYILESTLKSKSICLLITFLGNQNEQSNPKTTEFSEKTYQQCLLRHHVLNSLCQELPSPGEKELCYTSGKFLPCHPT